MLLRNALGSVLLLTIACSRTDAPSAEEDVSSDAGIPSVPPVPSETAKPPVAPMDAGKPADEHDGGVVIVDDAGSDLTIAIAIAVGDRHSCALLSTAEVACWGDNDLGQLGMGEIGGVDLPRTRVKGLPANATPVEIAAGGSHTCVRMATGSVYCWGANDFGQLGDGGVVDVEHPSPPSPKPVAVKDLSDAMAIGVGANHTCALVAAPNPIRCWGRQLHGALGNGFDLGNGISSPLTVTSALPSPPVSLSSRGDTNTVILASGTAWWWGEGGFGAAVALSPRAISEFSDVRSIGTDAGLVCALTGPDATHPLSCFGRAAKTPILVDTGIRAVGIGPDFLCTVHATGDLTCAGGFELSRPNQDITQIATSDQHICALTRHGRVFCVAR